jgi:hypothetical protein
MNKVLFERLVTAAQQRDVDITNSTKGRFLRRLSEEDAELMTSGDANSLVVSRHVRIVRVSFKDETYFCVFGLAEPDETPQGLEPCEMTPALFSIAVLEANVQPTNSISGSQIRDAIEDRFVGAENYEGHDLETIESLFPRILAYRIANPEPYLYEGEYRVLGALLARSYTDGPINISTRALENIWQLFESGSKYIPYRNLVQGIMSISWESLFLETYRCLEQLYAEPRVSALKDKWPSTLPLRDLAAMLEQHLSWRPKEDDALAKIISACEPELLKTLCVALGVEAQVENQIARAEQVSKKIYSIRNNVVHYRPVHEVINKTDLEWDAIVSALLGVVESLYEARGELFFSGNTDITISFTSHNA